MIHIRIMSVVPGLSELLNAVITDRRMLWA